MKFDWGVLSRNPEFMRVLRREILEENSYLRFFGIEEGETVLDIGASAGIFTFSILEFRPARVYCLEPHKELFRTLRRNMEGRDVTCVNAAIAPSDGRMTLPGLFNPDSMMMWSSEEEADTMSFRSLIEANGIKGIGFMKLDCEGGEYDVFDRANHDWIRQNVRKVAGEWHLHNGELKSKFRIFRDGFLKRMPDSRYWVLDMEGRDIKEGLWTEEFINFQECIMLYMRID